MNYLKAFINAIEFAIALKFQEEKEKYFPYQLKEKIEHIIHRIAQGLVNKYWSEK